MQYHNGALCVSAREIIDQGIMTKTTYEALAKRGRIRVLQRGCRACPALIDIDSLPEAYRARVRAIATPDPRLTRITGWIRANYTFDQQAAIYYADPALHLPPETVRQLIINASTLNAAITLYTRAKAALSNIRQPYSWADMATAITILAQEFHHTLPMSPQKFRIKVRQYQQQGYAALLSAKRGNQSARKVSLLTEQLICAIAAMPNKPFNTTVFDIYQQFRQARIQIYDPATGELFRPEDHPDLSEATIQRYLTLPRNRVLIEHATTSWTTFMHNSAPHVHRHAPEFSFSKISFDDRDLPRKLRDTRLRPKAYYAYDVASQCVVGYAYNRSKNQDLVIECFRSLFRLIDQNGWGCPAQVEVENHLMSQWRDSFLRAGEMFPFVRFCAPQNSQEKYAEQLNGAKKRSIEHRNHLGIGRFYARDPHYRTEANKIADETNELYQDHQYYTWDQLIADDIADIHQFNHSLHPNQKRYPGLTRWQVLTQNINPTLQPVDHATLARYIGCHVRTTIRRNSYCRVLGHDYWLSSTEVIERLAPADYQVDAYYIPAPTIPSPVPTDDRSRAEAPSRPAHIYIYQNGRYIDTLTDIGTFNTAAAEQTDTDRQIFTQQQKHIAHFRRYVADRTPTPAAIMPPESPATIPSATPESPATIVPSAIPESPDIPSSPDPATIDYAQMAFEDY